ncbi:NADP-dependent oxidoreductase [Candidatus Woesearchaeota archaeon]|nr:NADP-dependent oxidoreductase [Candidatus Woesearchaeota archaeon]
MKAAQISKYGGKEVVEIKEVPKPAASGGHVIIENHAAGVNPADWKIREGYFHQFAPLKFPATLGGDFSGVVAEVGNGVNEFRKGDEIFGQAIAIGGGSGSFAEFVSADAKKVAKKPRKASHLEAAAVPLAGVSAWQALAEHMNLSKGQKILIHGGAGGIGSFAIQIAKHTGAYVATTASADDLDFVKNLGADEAIDYKKQRFDELLKNYDAVFDCIGGETYARSFKVLKRGGMIVSMLEQPNKELMEQHGVTAISQFTQVTSEKLAELAKLIDAGAIKIHIDKTFPLDETADALEHLQNNHPRGKVVIEIN